ncbi:MAG: hypothetical protein J5854_05145 [Clostridia bacterium]|nr:hypothetical protein [Clostridia bacterium]
MKQEKKGKAFYINFAILAIAALLYAALSSPWSVAAMAGSFGAPVYRTARENEIAIQIAVAWDAKCTEVIADHFTEKGVAVTFAVGGEWAERHPELLKKLIASGHEIALLGSGGKDEMKRELALIEEAGGVVPSVCVFLSDDPEGFTDAAVLGLKAVRCTVELDGAADGLPGRIKGGDIISLLPTGDVLRALPEIEKIIKNMGLDIVPTYKMLYN